VGKYEKEAAVNALIVALVAVAAPKFAVGINGLQVTLERWDYQRHAED
jgi:hypothetical protein